VKSKNYDASHHAVFSILLLLHTHTHTQMCVRAYICVYVKERESKPDILHRICNKWWRGYFMFILHTKCCFWCGYGQLL